MKFNNLSIKLICSLIILILPCVLFSQTRQEAALLLSHLNLDAPGMEKVKAAYSPQAAVSQLFVFYRNGGGGKHPIDRAEKASARGHYASEKDIKTADDAMKHLLVGQSAYPPFERGKIIDWIHNPVPDNEWIWQLNRMSFWGAMSKAYWHTGDERYAEEWARQFVDWVRRVPCDKEHAVAWRSIEAGIRGHAWMALFQRFIDSPAFTPEVLCAFLNSCYDHASFLMTKYSKGSNWALMEAEGMAFIAIMFPQFKDALKWRNEAFRRLSEEIHRQVYPDGHQRELAMGYHLGCIGWFLNSYELAKLNGLASAFPPDYLSTIEKMCEVPMKLLLPDGTHTQMGDDWRGSQGQHNKDFLRWAKLFERPDFLYLATAGREGVPPAQTAYQLPQSGLYSMRSGWNKEAICLVLKCGPDGGWHCQPDNGTFVLYAGGQDLMPDGGCYIYSGDPKGRAWFRQSMTHQTLTLDNKDIAYAPRLLHWSTSPNCDVLVVENDSYENFTHRRAVFFVDKQYFVIVDEAIGTATGQLNLHFQFAPRREILVSKPSLMLYDNSENQWNVMVKTNPLPGLKIVEEIGQISERYTEKCPRPAYSYQLDKNTNKGIRFVTIVAPFFDSSMPSIDAEIVSTNMIGDKSLKLNVSAKGKNRILGYDIQ